MNITLCGTIACIDEMVAIKQKLKALGHEVKMPPTEIADGDGRMIPVKEAYLIRQTTPTTDGWIWDRKQEAMRNHFEKVAWSDVILVVNRTHKNIENYIGVNTLMEMGLAFHLGKKIFLLHPIPEVAYKEEIIGLRPVVIDEDLARLTT